MLTGETTLPAALRDYFGIKPSEMVQEFKALSATDKDEFFTMLTELGYNIKRAAA